MAMLWNFSHWMNRLGLNRQDQPELIYGVQPVVIMGDQSALVSPVLPPMAWAGGRRSGIVAVFGCVQLTSRAAGGTFVRILHLQGGANINRWSINTTPAAISNTIALVAQNMSADPVVSLPVLGTLAAQPFTTTVPSMENPGTGTSVIQEGFYIRPGFTLQIWTSSADNDFDPAMLYEDLPATAPRE